MYNNETLEQKYFPEYGFKYGDCVTTSFGAGHFVRYDEKEVLGRKVVGIVSIISDNATEDYMKNLFGAAEKHIDIPIGNTATIELLENIEHLELDI